MGNALLIQNRGLVIVAGGRSLLTDAGGAPCCCGQPSPCQCLENTPCVDPGLVQPELTVTFRAYKPSITSANATYSFGPTPGSCCCRAESENQSRKWQFLETQFYGPVGACPQGTPYSRRWWSATARGPSQLVPVTLFQRFSSGPASGCTLDINNDVATSVAFIDCLLIAGDSGTFDPSGDFLRGRKTGYILRTCSLMAGEIVEWDGGPGTPYPFYPFRYTTWRYAMSSDQEGCLDQACTPCCLPDGSCVMRRPSECLAAGGVPGPSGASCGTFPCGSQSGFGACCSGGQCNQTQEAFCTSQGGVFYPGTDCSQVTCPAPPVRACCLPQGGCLPMTQAECQAVGGGWDPNRQCGDPGACPEVMGACCTPGGAGALCTEMTSIQCAQVNGIFRAGLSCSDPDTCLGTCCQPNEHSPLGGACVYGNGEAFCNSIGGRWLGYGDQCGGEVWCSLEGLRSNQQGAAAAVAALDRPKGCSGCGKAAGIIAPWT